MTSPNTHKYPLQKFLTQEIRLIDFLVLVFEIRGYQKFKRFQILLKTQHT